MKRDFIKDNFENQARWIAHANSTASIILGFAGVSFFWVVTRIANAGIADCYELAALLMFVLTNGGCIVVLLMAVLPRINGKGNSLMFFGHIVRRQREEFIDEVAKLDDKGADELLVDQTHILAGIADRKFRLVRAGVVLLVLSILPAGVLIILL